MLVKEQLKKAPLSECPTFSKKELENAQYIATASVVEIKKCGRVLIVDYYNSKDKKMQVRFFSDGNNYISYIPSEDKWSNKAIYNLASGKCVSLTEHRQIAEDFFNVPNYQKNSHLWINFKKVEGITAACAYFVQGKAKEKSEKARDRKEAKVNLHFAMFPDWHNNKLNAFCDNQVFKCSYIFFSKLDKNRKRKVVCTNCKSHFELSDNIKHNNVGFCPVCGKEIKYCALWYCDEVQEKATVCYPFKKDDQLLVEFLLVTRHSFSDGCVSHNYKPIARTLYLKEKGKPKIYSYGRQNLPWYGYAWCNWGNRPVYREAFVYTENLNETFGVPYYNVDLQNILSKEKHPLDFIALLDNLKTIPCCEYLCKMGLTKLASQIETIDFDEKGSSFSECLGISAQYIGMYKQMGISIEEHRAIKNANCCVNAEWVEQYRQIKKQLKYGIDIGEFLEKMTLNRFWRYITKQKEIHSGRDLYQIAIWFRDYIRMSEELDVTLNKKNLYPIDIKQAHDILAERLAVIKATEMKEASKAALKFANEFFKGYEKDEFIVLMPKSRQDFIKEGQELSHCVGQERYYKNHIKGEKMIFFIRKADKPNVAYFTAEIDMVTFEVIQLYGYGDCLPNDKVRKFTKEFALYLKIESKKLRKAN